MHLSHIPQYTIQNRNVHLSVLNGVLWDMEQLYWKICEIGLIGHSLPLYNICENTVIFNKNIFKPKQSSLFAKWMIWHIFLCAILSLQGKSFRNNEQKHHPFQTSTMLLVPNRNVSKVRITGYLCDIKCLWPMLLMYLSKIIAWVSIYLYSFFKDVITHPWPNCNRWN